MNQVRKMDELKTEVYQMRNFSNGMENNMGELLRYTDSLEDEFKKLQQDALKLKNMNVEMGQNLSKIESRYMNRTNISY